MKLNLKSLLYAASLVLFMVFSSNTLIAQDAKKPTETAGCKPSSCRGATTKFGEAKIITEVRTSLIALKAEMEKSDKPLFDAESYDIEGIVGENDDESLAIIVNHVKMAEDAFATKLNRNFTAFELPENKAKQIKYLSSRIDNLKNLL